MDDITRDHESRISHLEGEMKSVATKDFVQTALDALRQEISNKIDEQTKTFQQALKEQNESMTTALSEQSNAITDLSNRENRLKGALDALKYALPLIISVAAIVIAALIK